MNKKNILFLSFFLFSFSQFSFSMDKRKLVEKSEEKEFNCSHWLEDKVRELEETGSLKKCVGWTAGIFCCPVITACFCCCRKRLQEIMLAGHAHQKKVKEMVQE